MLFFLAAHLISLETQYICHQRFKRISSPAFNVNLIMLMMIHVFQMKYNRVCNHRSVAAPPSTFSISA